MVVPDGRGQIPQVGGGRGGQGGASGDDRADDPVGEPVGEVAEDVVVGHELPVVLRHRPEQVGDLTVELFQLTSVGRRGRPDPVRLITVEFGGELLLDDPDGLHHPRGIGPEVRVLRCPGAAGTGGVVERVDQLTDLEDLDTFTAGVVEDGAEPLLQTESVGDDQVGVLHLPGFLGRDAERVGIGVRLHQHPDLGGVADEPGDHVTEDVGGDDDVRLPVVTGAGDRTGGAENQGQNGGVYAEAEMARHHLPPVTARAPGAPPRSNSRVSRSPSATSSSVTVPDAGSET